MSGIERRQLNGSAMPGVDGRRTDASASPSKDRRPLWVYSAGTGWREVRDCGLLAVARGILCEVNRLGVSSMLA